MAAIRAQTLVMPSATDLYFTPEDCALDARGISGARLLVIPSIWGHGTFWEPAGHEFIDAAVKELLQANSSQGSGVKRADECPTGVGWPSDNI